MADKSTGIKLKVSAVDATARVFKNIASSAARVTGSIAKWGAAAGGVAGGALAVTVNKLSKLSDVAQSAGATTEELTKLSGALSILGVKGSAPEELAAAFQRMTKTTGEVGVEGFHKMIREISKLPTITERSEAAMKVFGRAGLQFMPAIEGAARNGIGALKDVEAAMPGISQAAAEAGDRFSDATTIMAKAAAKIWNEGIGKVAELIDSKFTGGVRTAALVCAAQMEYFAKAAWAYIKPFFTNFSESCKQLAETVTQWAGNVATIIGGIFVTAGENMATEVNGFFYRAFAGLDAFVQEHVFGDVEAAARAINLAEQEGKRVSDETRKNWNNTFKLFEGLKWGLADGPLGAVDLSALQAQRDAAIETAKKAGEAYGKAAVPIGAADRAKFGAPGARGAADKQTNPEAILGGTYKAITYAMRAGYATAQEKIAKGVDKIAGLLKGVKDNTQELADNMDFGVVEG